MRKTKSVSSLLAPPAHPPLPIMPFQGERIHLVAIGAGGTGSWVAQWLSRLVWAFNREQDVHEPGRRPRRASLLLIDPDRVEERNILARQNFCAAEIGLPKAEVLAHRYRMAFPGLGEDGLAARARPFSGSLVPREERSLTILVGCVDNAAARREIAACLKASTPSYGIPANRHEAPVSRTWWVDSGNALAPERTGQVLLGNTARLEDLRGAQAPGLPCLRVPSPALLHPELLADPPREAGPNSAPSCADAPGEEQARTINAHMAALVYAYVEGLIYGGLTTFATYTNLSTFTTRSSDLTPEALALALGQPVGFFTGSRKRITARTGAP